MKQSAIYKMLQIAVKYGEPPGLNEPISTAYDKLLVCMQAMDNEITILRALNRKCNCEGTLVSYDANGSPV